MVDDGVGSHGDVGDNVVGCVSDHGQHGVSQDSIVDSMVDSMGHMVHTGEPLSRPPVVSDVVDTCVTTYSTFLNSGKLY